MAGIGSTLGGIVGLAGGPIGSAIGTMAGGVLEALPALIKTDAEKENERRLAALRRQQDMGTLGLTEAEKQSMYTAGVNQIGGQLQQAQAQSRAVGAAGMASGAGLSALQQAQFAESAAKAAAGVSQNVEVQNIRGEDASTASRPRRADRRTCGYVRAGQPDRVTAGQAAHAGGGAGLRQPDEDVHGRRGRNVVVLCARTRSGEVQRSTRRREELNGNLSS